MNELYKYINPSEPLQSNMTMYDVFECFRIRKNLSFMPVVDSERKPLGIVREYSLKDYAYGVFGRELIKRMSLRDFLCPCLTVGEDISRENFLTAVATRMNLPEGIIVTDKEGLYRGIIESNEILNIYEDHRQQIQQKLDQIQVLESVGTLAGGIAHDFNNIIAGILGHVQLSKLKTNPSDNIFRTLSVIEDLTQRAAKITQHLLGFARAGKYAVQTIDIRDVVHETMEVCKTFDRKIAFELKLSPSPCIVTADKNQMGQVLLNLFINARDAMPEGGTITVSCSCLDPSDFRCEQHFGKRSDGCVILTVADTGSGMSSDVMCRIFDPFFTTKAPGKGTGLGLAMVYGTVKNHGGSIFVDSEIDKGSVFSLFFPIDLTTATKEDAEATAKNSRRTPLERDIAVLVIDDEPVVLETTSRYLEEMGCRVLRAENGEEGLAIFLNNRNDIDVVVLDIIMPVLSGHQIFHEIRKVKPSVFIILVSGYSLNGTIQGLLKQKRTVFLQKPILFQDLGELVMKAAARGRPIEG